MEKKIKSKMMKIKNKISVGKDEEMLKRWFVEEKGKKEEYIWEKNEEVDDWMIDKI